MHSTSGMRAYIINLDSAEDRWASVERILAGQQFTLCRVSAVDGHALQLPIAEYSETLHRWFHGRPTSFGQVGCYLSHIRAMKAFLATDEEYALIGEDDLTLHPDFEAVVDAALRYSRHWNILRLTGLSDGVPAKVMKLFGDYSLCVSLGRVKGTGAYVIDRRAALTLASRLLPMWLPIDHALDREWFFRLRAAYILPFPASQCESGFRSSIQKGTSRKLSSLRRCVATYPYQAFNEVTRWLFRTTHYLRIKSTATACV
ncbi:glycosyltransferase family 25 protein [Verrucomicrobiota bacterium sgz303538]